MTRSLSFALALIVVALSPAVYAAPPAEVAVTSCGQVVPKKTLGYLTGDLDCTGFTGGPANVEVNYQGAAVYVEKKGKLDLRGFTLTAGRWGVLCDALICKKDHPCSKGPCEVFNGTLVASDPHFNGIMGNRPVVHDVTLSGFWYGVVGYTHLLLSDAVIQDSGSIGVLGRGLVITTTSITNSGQFGVDGWSDLGPGLRLNNSTVTGNGTGPYCGDYPCADVAGMRFPRVVSSTCATSYNVAVGGTWGVCAGD